MHPLGCAMVLLLLMPLSTALPFDMPENILNREREQNIGVSNNNENTASSKNRNKAHMDMHAMFQNVLIILTIVFVLSLMSVIYLYNKKSKPRVTPASSWTAKNTKPAAPASSSRWKK